jgi:hypothetical protein
VSGELFFGFYKISMQKSWEKNEMLVETRKTLQKIGETCWNGVAKIRALRKVITAVNESSSQCP